MDVNRALCAQSSVGMFVTAFYAVLEPTTRTLIFTNAGHNPPLVRQASGQIEDLARCGMALGVLTETTLVERTLTLAPGDALVAYTDGVTDAVNPQGERFGVDRLTAAVASSPPAASAFLDHLLTDLAAFTQGAAQPDDIT
ncbi:MAG: serine/threonine-protein phosphatase, partial [Chloroflexi bacterium]|nr:serine/threonine-protein phosphatase [Chloroflexota bacterium]